MMKPMMKQMWIELEPRKKAVLVFAILFVVALGFSTVYRATYSPVHRTDFTVYTAAARAVLDNTHLYDAHNVRGWYYMYLPTFAIAMVPFALVSTFWAALIWYLLSIAMFAHATFLSVQLARKAYPHLRIAEFWLPTLAVLLVQLPMMSGIARGQISVLIMYLVTLCIWLTLTNRQWMAGLCLTGAIVLKIFPGLLVPYFIIKQRWKVALATTAALILLVLVVPGAVFGPAKNLRLLQEWTLTIAFPANKPDDAAGNLRFEQMINPLINRNQSLQAVAIRTSEAFNIGAEKRSLVQGASLVAALLMLIVSAWACMRGGRSESTRRFVLQICLVLVLMLILAPVSWVHNYVLALLPCAVAIAAWFSLDTSGRERRALGFAAVAYAVGGTLSIFDAFAYIGAHFWGAFILWAALLRVLLNEPAEEKVPGDFAKAGATV